MHTTLHFIVTRSKYTCLNRKYVIYIALDILTAGTAYSSYIISSTPVIYRVSQKSGTLDFRYFDIRKIF